MKQQCLFLKVKSMGNNVLILSAGRRVELINIVKNVVATLNSSISIFAADMNPQLSAACQVADQYFQVMPVCVDGYVEQIKSICKNNDIKIVIPTIDTELLILSKNKTIFKSDGIDIIISDEKNIEKCRDKRKTGEIFNEINIKYPKIFEKSKIEFPCFCKPFNGSCSKGACLIKNKDDLQNAQLLSDENMFMEYINHDYKEVTVDVYFNKQSELCCVVPRERLEVRAGEVSKGVTRKNFLYEFLITRLASLSGFYGCITMQFFYNEAQNDIIGLEINPRLGGGYPLTDASKATYIQWLLEEYLYDKKINFFDKWEADLVMLRYDAKVLVHAYR